MKARACAMIAGVIGLGLGAESLRAAAVGTAFTYQGHMTDGGTPADGTYDFEFRLFDSAAGGLQVGGTVTKGDLPLADGLFTTTLDFGASPFAGEARWLEIRVRPGDSGGAYTTLSPRQELTPTPYALFSAAPWKTSGTSAYYDGGFVGVGTSSPTDLLHVAGGNVLVNSDSGYYKLVYGPTGDGWRLATSGQGTALRIQDIPGGGTRLLIQNSGEVGIGTFAPAEKLHVMGGRDTGLAEGGYLVLGNTAAANVSFDNNEIQARDNAAASSLYLNHSGGNVYVAAAAQNAFVGVNRSSKVSSSEYFGVYAPAEAGEYGGMYVQTKADTSRPYFGYRTPTQSAWTFLDGESGDWRVYNEGAWLTVTDEGLVGVGTTAPEVKLHVRGGTDAELPGGGYVVLGDTGSTNLVIDPNEIMARDNGAASTLHLNFEGGDVNIAPNGTTTVATLEITGGGDLSENFEVGGGGIQPGMVVVIDPDRPGELKASTHAYDRRVAGIVSGANGIRPGMTMGQTGTIVDGKHPVALTGRVYCYADATEQPIEPGDLLTTSDTPGRAMKAADHQRSHGAIIGKAMTGLRHGESGMILVLVNLQ